MDVHVRWPAGPVRIVQVRVRQVEVTAVEMLDEPERLVIANVLEIGGEPVVCVICFTNVSNPIEYLMCGHIFCAGCIAQWARERDTCPMCLAPLVATPVHTMEDLLRWSRLRPRE